MSAFDCSNCQHSSARHTVKRWPTYTPYCQDCGCTGYQPHYRNATKQRNAAPWHDDKGSGAI
jgi:hypothetical protein